MGRPPIGKTAMSAAERHKRYMARLRARAAAGEGNATQNKPAASEHGIQLEREILVDDEGEGYITAYTEPYGLYVSQIGNVFFWHVLKDDDDKDAVDVAEGEVPSLVAAMAAAEAATAPFPRPGVR
jgi:hypothetical protein